jgi:hypothetical protein
LVVPMGLLLAVLACGGDVTLPVEGEAATLEIVGGDEQQGLAGTALPEAVIVRVEDTRGRPVANQEVTFTIGSGGGSVEPASVSTSSTGEATASWTLGADAGSQLLRARTARGGSTEMLEVSFSATALAGSGSVIVGMSGDDQTGPVNSALADSLVVRTTDALGNPVANVEVTWTVTGGGSISPLTVRTDEAGLAAAERVLGATAGAQTARATVEGFTGSPVTFSHTAEPANPTTLVLVSGNNQTAPGGFEAAEDLVVRLQDDNGNGIGGRSISWVVSSGAGSVSPTTISTDPNGLATTRWTLPVAVGTYTNAVSAVFSGLPPVQFTATATADAPSTIELVSGNNQSAVVGTQLANPLVVRVTDANGNPVSNVGVSWTAEVGGTVSANNTATDENGLAQVNRTLGLLPVTYTTIAAVDGLDGSPIAFTSTATVGAPSQLVIVAQPGSPVASGAVISPAAGVQVQDAQGNPVLQGGITVQANISSSTPGATLGVNDQRQTNTNGRANFANLTISGPPGNYRLTFTASVGGNALTAAESDPIEVTTGAASRIVILTQPSATAVNGANFAQQPVVQIQDADGNPVETAGLAITAAIQDGQPALGPSATVNANTDGDGIATFTNLRITGVVGSRTLLFSRSGLVSVESSPIAITAGPPTVLEIQTGNGQSAAAGTAVATDPAVRVTDQSGNPIAGVQIDFDITGGGGSVSPGTVTTGANGIAAVDSWTLGAAPGPNTLRASVPSLPALGNETFTATGTSTNTAPTAAGDAFPMDEDGTLTVNAPGVLGNDDDPDVGDEITAVLDAGPANAQTFTLNPDGSFTYVPVADFNGSDSFTYHVTDGEAESNTATVTITVNAVDDPPGFQALGDVSSSALVDILTGTTVEGWASDIVGGPPDESQAVTFTVTTDNDAAFLPGETPQISPEGTLTYHAAPTIAPIPVAATAVAQDVGGNLSGEVDFTITINP